MQDNTTLYERLIEIENKHISRRKILDRQKKILEEYALNNNNPIYQNAIDKEKSVTETLLELAEINKGYRQFIPWDKNPEHNEALSQLGELVDKPKYLRTKGILFPNNIMTTGAELSFIAFVESLLTSKYEPMSEPNFIAFAFVPMFALFSNVSRFRQVDTTQAEYIDSKIYKIYK
ncbi:MAG: hypothetical protein ACP5N1_03910 [Candidatus Woesearchaeota archaeon]